MTINPISPDYFLPDRFRGKTILITGSATGIGAATAIRAAREGANVACVDKKERALRATVSGIASEGNVAMAILADVSSTADADQMVADTVSTFGRLDLALNAAGVMDGTDPSKPHDFGRDAHLMPKPIHEANDEY